MCHIKLFSNTNKVSRTYKFLTNNIAGFFACEKNEQDNDHSKKGGKDQESIQSSTTPDPAYHMGKWRNTINHHKQDPRGQSFHSRWPQGSNEQMQKPDKH